MGTRAAALALLLALGACTHDGNEEAPEPRQTTDADCATVIPDHVFATLGWTASAKPAEATILGCHREAEQGYVEVRERSGYDRICKTLDRTGQKAPGVPVDWLEGETACAVEPDGDVGVTKVVVQREGAAVVQITIAVLTSTPQAQVRAAAAELVGTS
jgi:hypothetical protein